MLIATGGPSVSYLLDERTASLCCRPSTNSVRCAEMTTKEQPRRTQVQRRLDAERSLVAAAAEVVAERGIERASLAIIGERAGASRGLANHHFGTKEALVAQVATLAQDRLSALTVEAIERSHRHVEELTGAELALAVVDTYLAQFENPSPADRALIVMWGAMFPSESSIDGMLEADRRAYSGWSEIIKRGQGDGSIRSDIDASATAVALHGLMRGVAALLLTESEYTDMRSVRRTVSTFLAAAFIPVVTPKAPSRARKRA